MKMKCVVLGLASIALLVLGAGGALAQAPELDKILASDGQGADYFGRTLELDGPVLVVGAYAEDAGGSSAGAVYVFRFDGTDWVEEQKLMASDAAASDYFGWSLDVDGDRIIVGAYQNDDTGTSSGSAYIFKYDGSTWNEEVKLTASDAAAGDEFGYAVGIEGDWALVGARYVDLAITQVGAVYAFERHPVFGWTEQQKLVPSDVASNDRFGNDISMDGNWAIVGDKYDHTVGGSDTGSAVMYMHDGSAWIEKQKIIASNAGSNDWFGGDVHLKGNMAVVGADREDTQASNAGAAYIFRYDGSTWNEEKMLVADDGAASDYFGHAVATTGSMVMVGAYGAAVLGSDCGAMYSYASRGTDWALDMKYSGSAIDPSDNLGTALAADGNRAFAGTPYDDDKAGNAGCVYLFSIGEFILTALPANVSEGDTLTFEASYGNPGAPFALFVVDVNGQPFVFMLLWHSFSADYQFHLSAPVPPGLNGLSVSFLGFKANGFKKAIASNIATVNFN